MVSPSSRRRAVKHIVGEGMGSAAQACRAIGLARSSLYRASQANEERREMQSRIIDFSEQNPRYGYRRVTALLRAEGANQIWSWDFVHDQTQEGRPFRILTLIDEHTKQCLATHVGWSVRAVDVITVIEASIQRYGAPEHIRSDNGSEFIARAIQDWLSDNEIKIIYIKPGSPWEQPFIESFHDKLRDECLNREMFGSLLEARIIIEQWRIEYNQRRPHSSLGYLTPRRICRAA